MNPILLFIIAVAVVAILSLRFWPLSNADFHVDPFTIAPPNSPNFYLSKNEEGIFSVPAHSLVQALEKMVATLPRVTRISAGSDGLFHVTYVSRSLVFGFPDLISIKILESSPTSSKIKLFSRSRFGHSDLGVNRARVQVWLATLRENLGT